MKVLLLCLLIWLSVLGLACYLLGVVLVYFILMVILSGIVLDGELIPWRGKKTIETQPHYVRTKINQPKPTDFENGLSASEKLQVVNTSDQQEVQ